jgi:hypothetical protein
VVEDRQVVRGEVPEHVDVPLHQPEVDPHRVEVVQVAEDAAVHQLADLGDRRRVAERVVAHEHQAPGGRGVDQRLPLVERARERLLHQHVLAGLEGRHGDVVVGAGRGGDGDAVDRVVGQHVGQGGRGPHGAVGAEHGTRPLLLDVAQPVQPELR